MQTKPKTSFPVFQLKCAFNSFHIHKHTHTRILQAKKCAEMRRARVVSNNNFHFFRIFYFFYFLCTSTMIRSSGERVWGGKISVKLHVITPAKKFHDLVTFHLPSLCLNKHTHTQSIHTRDDDDDDSIEWKKKELVYAHVDGWSGELVKERGEEWTVFFSLCARLNFILLFFVFFFG